MIMSLHSLGVTENKEKQFEKKNIKTVQDLAEFLPRKYLDCQKITGLQPSDQLSILEVVPTNVFLVNTGRLPMLKATCTVNGVFKPNGKSETIYVIWFSSEKYVDYVAEGVNSLIHKTVYVAGHYDAQYKSISKPIFFTSNPNALRILPIYSKIAGMGNDYLTNHIDLALRMRFDEPYPVALAEHFNLISYNQSLHSFHHPASYNDLNNAITRRDFDLLLRFALRMEQQNREQRVDSPFVFRSTVAIEKILTHLPYELTPDQRECIEGIVNGCMSGKRVNALVQGDVGCGKTIIAFLAMFMAADNGYQAAMMAPTQVLAKQHYADIIQYAELTGITVACLTSDMTAKQQREVVSKIKSGEVSIVIGTSSVIGKNVQYNNLALTVVDEEHKFGVIQKRTLAERAREGVHCLVMSATPIPRSLATIVHGGNMELYTIKTMPKGRQPVTTRICYNKDEAIGSVIDVLQQGRQAYVVCPAIDKNEDYEDIEAVEDVYTYYENILSPLGYKVAVLTGRTKKGELSSVIEAFQNNEIQVLVATTVIEVGVNVPNACAMVVHNAERFGLSGLHQLRGRVGRGNHPSICLLISDRQCERLDVMCSTTDGFRVAEADLMQRGAGELFGVRQSGIDKYTELILLRPELYHQACEMAKIILDENVPCIFMDEWMDDEPSDELKW